MSLVLTRCFEQSIRFITKSGPIVVKVVQVKGKQIRLAINCAKDIQIDRLDENGNIEERKNNRVT